MPTVSLGHGGFFSGVRGGLVKLEWRGKKCEGFGENAQRIHCLKLTYPIPSMYDIFTYIWLIFMENVGKYM